VAVEQVTELLKRVKALSGMQTFNTLNPYLIFLTSNPFAFYVSNFKSLVFLTFVTSNPSR
jgi:hypothetical protein